MGKRWIAAVLAVGLIGCGDEPGEPAVEPPEVETTAPATQPALPTEPVETEAATVEVAGQPYLLPPMRLGVRETDRGLVLQLYGSDAREHATGNTLYLEMEVEAVDWTKLGETPWHFESPDDLWTDTPRGITLSDERWVLRPADVTVNFTPIEHVATIELRGEFLMWDMTASIVARPQRVTVEGTFPAAMIAE